MIKKVKDGVLIDVEVSPNASKTAILGYDRWRDAIKVSVKSPPKGGKANRELLEFLSDLFDCRVEILKGERSTRKVVILKGVDYEKVLNVLSTKSVK